MRQKIENIKYYMCNQKDGNTKNIQQYALKI